MTVVEPSPVEVDEGVPESAPSPPRPPSDGPSGPLGSARRWARRAGVQVVVFAGIALVATLTSAPGRYVGENRVDQYFAPGRRLLRTLFLWDPTRGMGRTREDLWPIQLVPLSILRGLGLDAVTAQRVWHALLLTTAAAGAAAVVRAVRRPDPVPAGSGPEPGAEPDADAGPSADAGRDADGGAATESGPRATVEAADGDGGSERDGLAPFVAGLVYGFGPYSLTFLTPANLYAAYAVAPWVVLCAWRGARSRRPWAWAAGAALLVGSLGNADLPGVTMAMVAVPVVALASSRRAGRGWRGGLGWLARAGALTLGVSAAALWKTAAAAAVFNQRLTSTESPKAVGVASSWSESLRGLGFWLSYFRGPELARPQTAPFFTDPVIVLVTFVPVLLALVALLLPEVRTRVLWGTLLLLGAVAMVGVHPTRDPVPAGSLLLDAFDRWSFVSGFRTTYKAGAVMMLGVAVLAGLGLSALLRRVGGRGEGRVLLGVGVVVLLAASSLPVWTGSLYDETRTSGEVPEYWAEAARYINAMPGEGRLLVLPATTRSVYRWGWVGDDVVDSLITRPHVVDTSVPLSTAEAADIVAAVSAAADDARYRPGAVPAVLRRLGIDHVLIRNDLDAAESRTLDPARLGSIRTDPGLRLERSFDDEADDVSGRGSATSDTRDVSSLPELELYAVVDPGPSGPRVAPADGALVVSGSGAGMLPLGADGDLSDHGTVRFSGGSTAEELTSDLAQGGRLVLTDTNRRRVTVVSGLVRNESWTLAEGEDLDRPGGALYDTEGSQTVAWYRDATRITSDGAPRGGRGAQPWTRPAAAFDGSASTWWQTVELQDQEGITLRVDLREPTEVRRVRIEPLPAPPSAARVTQVRLRFSDGTERLVDVSSGATTVQVDAGPSDWVEVEISEVSDGIARPVGLREVQLGDLDLREWIALPDDVATRAADAPELAAALEDVPLTITASRDQPEATIPVEPLLRRRVRMPSTREMSLQGEVVVGDEEQALELEAMRTACVDDQVRVDGEPVPVRLADPEAALDLGDRVVVEACEPVVMERGWREVEVTADSTLDHLRLDAGVQEPSAANGSVGVRTATPDAIEAVVDAPDGGILVTGQSFDERWIATADGQDLGPARLHDGQSGWTLPPGSDQQVRMEFRPASRFRAATWISLVSVILCIVLIARRPRRAPGSDPPPAA